MNVTSYQGNPWLGLFLKTNDSVTLVPVDAMEKLTRNAEEHLRTQTMHASVGDSNLLGLYCAMNTNGLVLPNVARDEEVNALKKTGLNVYRSSAKQNAHGNNMVVNDRGGMINPDVDTGERKHMEDVLGVELVPGRLAEYSAVGSVCLATNKGFLVHYAASEQERAQLESTLKVKGNVGSMNMGAGFVRVAAVANANGYLAGEASSAFERGRLEEALGFL